MSATLLEGSAGAPVLVFLCGPSGQGWPSACAKMDLDMDGVFLSLCTMDCPGLFLRQHVV
jgi:hypothetical protein